MAELTATTTRKDYSVSMAQANVYSMLIVSPLIVLLIVLYGGLWGFDAMWLSFTSRYQQPGGVLVSSLIFLALFMVVVVVHEAIHAITWALAGKKPWSAIQLGFQISTLTPYAHCREPLPINAYRLGTLMPGLLTGLLPALVSAFLGNGWLAFFGGVMVLAAGGDLLILWLIRKVNAVAMVEDHPTRAGCFVLE